MRVLRFVLGSVVGVLALLLCSVAPALAGPASASGDLNSEACPNEALAGFSGLLPDCRAYELVSPVVKNGDRVAFNYALAGGERVAADSIGVLAGATSDPACGFTDLDLARGAGGWGISALTDAPLSEYAYASDKCSKVLVNGEGASVLLLRPPFDSVYERDLYRQRPGGAGFEEIGPMLPLSGLPAAPTGPSEQEGASNYVGATPDLSDVLFTLRPLSEAERWPGDETVIAASDAFFNTSLYEYAGTGDTAPHLVGVDNGGALISDCGTAPGGGQQLNNNRLDVISSDGGRVFFTAVGRGDPATPECEGAKVLPAAEELFARFNGTEPQSPLDAHGQCTVAVDACTVAISQPRALPESPTPDPGCTTPVCEANIDNEANFRDANFEGASTDGAKVFFSSPQQLLNGASQDNASHEENGELTQDGAVPVNGRKGCAHTTPGAGGCNLYEYDFAENPETGKPVGLVLVSKADASGGGVGGPRVQGVAAVSEDGSHVFFVAKGVLTATANVEGASATEGGDNLYVTDTVTGRVAFIATLAPGDASQWRYDGHEPMDTTGDGEFLVFTSSAELTRDDTGSEAQVFRYDTATAALVRVSAGEEGFNDDGNSALRPALIEHAGSETEGGIGAVGRDPHPAVAEDGTVVFKSSAGLTARALDEVCVYEEAGECFEYAQNVYEYREGHVYLISGNVSHPLGLFEGAVAIGESGRDIFFESREALVPQDPDTLTDVYDARVDGGFPRSALPAACAGADCQQPAPAPRGEAPPASSTFSGPAGPVPGTTVAAAKPKQRPLTRAQRLAAALKLCRKEPKARRGRCRARARHQFATKITKITKTARATNGHSVKGAR